MPSKVSALLVNKSLASEASDLNLLESTAMGSKAALGELFRRYHKDVYRFLARLTPSDSADLDDMVQTTFVLAARSAARFEGRSAPKTWLFGIAANVARMRCRSEQRRNRMFSILKRFPLNTCTLTPQTHTENREALRRVRAALDQLSPKLREVFVLCALEGISCAEAARTLDIPEGTLWRRLHEARVRLQHKMEKEG